jgi:hypothetical protein
MKGIENVCAKVGFKHEPSSCQSLGRRTGDYGRAIHRNSEEIKKSA